MKLLVHTRRSVLHVHHWVLWWIGVGIVCGIVAVINILFHHLSRFQEDILLIFGLIYWVMAGVMCWAAEAIHVEKHGSRNAHRPAVPSNRPPQAREWHSASEFRLPGGGRMLLTYPYPHSSHETLAHYGRKRYGERGEKL